MSAAISTLYFSSFIEIGSNFKPYPIKTIDSETPNLKRKPLGLTFVSSEALLGIRLKRLVHFA